MRRSHKEFTRLVFSLSTHESDNILDVVVEEVNLLLVSAGFGNDTPETGGYGFVTRCVG